MALNAPRTLNQRAIGLLMSQCYWRYFASAASASDYTSEDVKPFIGSWDVHLDIVVNTTLYQITQLPS